MTRTSSFSDIQTLNDGDALLEKHVAKVVDSGPFARAELLRKLLLYLWDNRERDFNEYAVATEALGRRADFDPKTDASVRVLISRLRQKLKDYYDTEGAEDSFELQILLGTHALTVIRRSDCSEPAVVELPAVISVTRRESPPGWLREHRFVAALLLLCFALLISNGWLLWDRQRFDVVKAQTMPAATTFWKTFFEGPAPVKIMLPSPVFFVYPHNNQLHVRDVNVNDYDSWRKSALLRSFQNKGEPRLDHYYTVTSATLASIALAQYLDKVGLGNRLSFDITGDASMNLLDHSSVVALGTHATLYEFRDYLSMLDFSLGPDENFVANAHPGSGEKTRYDDQPIAQDRNIEPSLVALLPGRSSDTKLLIMQARHTAGLVELLTSGVGNNLFEKMYRDHGSPRYFQMVIESEVVGNNVLRSWPVALHTYVKGAPLGPDAMK